MLAQRLRHGALFGHRPCTQHRADDGEPLAQHQAEIDLGLAAAEERWLELEAKREELARG